MAVLRIKCHCGQDVSASVGDKIYNNRLYWFQSYHCANCGETIEMDSDAQMPSEVKEAIVAKQGKYGLFVSNRKDRAKAEFILKKMPHGDLSDFKLFLERKTEEIIRGTQNEVLIVENFLAQKGIHGCSIKQITLPVSFEDK